MPHPFRTAVEQRDQAAMVALLAPDVVFNSPVAFHPFVGREAAAILFANLFEVVEDFTYVDELAGVDTHALVFTASVAGRQLQGLDHLRFGPDGLVSEFTVMVRPMSGLAALAEAMSPRMSHVAKG